MYRVYLATCAGFLMASGGAFGSTFIYTSAPLAPGTFGNGATQVVVAFAAPSPPAPGKCLLTFKLKSYADGARKLHDLKTGGYVIIKKVIKELPNGQETTIPTTYAKVCLDSAGSTLTGNYQIYATRTAGIVFEEFFADNQEVAGGDRVEFDLYLGGEVPQVYLDSSTQPGAWQLIP